MKGTQPIEHHYDKGRPDGVDVEAMKSWTMDTTASVT